MAYCNGSGGVKIYFVGGGKGRRGGGRAKGGGEGNELRDKKKVEEGE